MENGMRNIQPEHFLTRQHLAHLRPQDFQVPASKIVTNDEAAAVQVFAEVCDLLVRQRKESRLRNVSPWIVEKLGTVELHDFVGRSRCMDARKLADHGEK